jgi:hypothetical protein
MYNYCVKKRVILLTFLILLIFYSCTSSDPLPEEISYPVSVPEQQQAVPEVPQNIPDAEPLQVADSEQIPDTVSEPAETITFEENALLTDSQPIPEQTVDTEDSPVFPVEPDPETTPSEQELSTSPESIPETTDPTVIAESDAIPPEETPAVQELPSLPIIEQQQLEYARSVNDVTDEVITQDTFAEDKEQILRIISELERIISERDYYKWLSYLSPSSLQYWSNPHNLEAISARLPVKGLQIRSLEDYFRYVFIPSRTGHVVDEIRYVSSTFIMAVQVQDTSDIIYYYFVKVNNRWLLRLDMLES